MRNGDPAPAGRGPEAAVSERSRTQALGVEDDPAHGWIIETVVSPFHCLYQDALEFHKQGHLRLPRSEAEASRLSRASLLLYLESAEALVHQAAAELARPALAHLLTDPSRPLPALTAWSLLPAIVGDGPARPVRPGGRALGAIRRASGVAVLLELPGRGDIATGVLSVGPQGRHLRASPTPPGPAGAGDRRRSPRPAPHRPSARSLRPPPPSPGHRPRGAGSGDRGVGQAARRLADPRRPPPQGTGPDRPSATIKRRSGGGPGGDHAALLSSRMPSRTRAHSPATPSKVVR